MLITHTGNRTQEYATHTRNDTGTHAHTHTVHIHTPTGARIFRNAATHKITHAQIYTGMHRHVSMFAITEVFVTVDSRGDNLGLDTDVVSRHTCKFTVLRPFPPMEVVF